MYKPPPAVGPDFHVIRVLHRHKDKTSAVEVLWHGRAKPKTPRLGFIYLEPDPLDLDARHVTLGKFIDTWSKLEGILRGKIEQILGNGTPAARTVSYAYSGKALVEFLVNITEPFLIPSKHREYVNLSERLSRATTTRNRLVHGYWTLENIVELKNDVPMVTSQPVREYPPSSPLKLAALQVIGSKERSQFLWTLDQIEQRRRDIEVLMESYRLFHNANLPWPPKALG